MKLDMKFMLNLFRSNVQSFAYATSPLDQFEIRSLINLDIPFLLDLHISLTNIALYLILAGFITFCLNILTQNYNRLVSNN